MPFTKRVTGPGVTERVNMVSADLGAVCYDPKRKAYAYVFGDNFAERYLRGEWQSPSIVMYDADHNLLGIPAGTTDIISSGNRRQALDYAHNAGGISTILPCDLNRFGNTWHLSGMVVGMGGLGDERATQFWTSPDLVNFTKTPVSLEHHPPTHPGNVMLTYDKKGDWVYIFGTGGLARNRPIYLWRCVADRFPEDYWEPWGQINGLWAWGNANENSPVLQGRYGELSFRFIQGNAVLSFFDVDNYSCSAITVPGVTDDWSQGNRVDYARGPEVFQLYGGYICPDSKLNTHLGMKFIVSQWNTQANDPYHVIAFSDTLAAAGPLIEEKPEPVEPLPKPQPPEEGGAMTPQQLYELLLRELSASGSEVIMNPEGEKLTLRQAIEEIHYKERGGHGLEGGRPRHPGQEDDQLGHVLNARAEGLFTQSVVVALAEKAGIDCGALYAQVQEALR